MKEQKFQQCADCIYIDHVFNKSDCAKCENGNKQTSFKEFNEDMGIWHDDWEDTRETENKLQFVLIKWLVRLILKYNAEDGGCFWFNGIVHKPHGVKQIEDVFPFWLRLLFPIVYVYQWRDGGYSGDDYAGNLYYRLCPFVWLDFGYEM